MTIILFDNIHRKDLYPFSQTKAIANLHYGIFSVRERWELISGFPVYINTVSYLKDLYTEVLVDKSTDNDFLFIDAALKDEDSLRTQILSIQPGDAIYDDVGLIAGRSSSVIHDFTMNATESFFSTISVTDTVKRLQYPWQMVLWNDEQIRRDFLLLFSRSTTHPVSETNNIIQPENILIDSSALIEHCFINASTGPVFIGKNAVVMEGSLLRGPIAIGENATIKMGTKIYGATTIAPYCVAGGEIKNSVMQPYSNKAHDGYLGDSVIGSWCNLGAGTSNSNVKNTANDIYVLNDSSTAKMNVGKKFGFVMGDYSRTAINTSINTGSLFGICCNIFGEGLMPKSMKNFSWGTAHDASYDFDKAIDHIRNWKTMKGHELSAKEISVLKYIFEREKNK